MFKHVLRRSLPLLLAFLALLAVLTAPVAHAEEDYLEPEAAFRFSSRMLDAKTKLPEVIAVPVSAGLPAYLAWIAQETRKEIDV